MSVELDKKTLPRLVAFLLEYRDETSEHELAAMLMDKFTIRQKSSIEIHENNGTFAAYRYGNLVEKLEEEDVLPFLVGEADVLLVEDSPIWDEEDGSVYPTLQGLYGAQFGVKSDYKIKDWQASGTDLDFEDWVGQEKKKDQLGRS